ncbi:MFS transporter [Streptomyces sp. NPDC056480]|uniref:MFS transporter n=1 Tax=Streptomyces sp. NPDC056480 TaxID=3345833 RepID=UPI0036D1259C
MMLRRVTLDEFGRVANPTRLQVAVIIVATISFVEIAPLQYTMVFAAVPQIAPSFPGVGANISWMLIVFLLVGGSLTPIIGKMSDMWGKRRLLLAVGVAFFAGNLICAVTTSWPVFLIGRGVAALGYATPVLAFGLFRDILPRRYVPIAVGSVAGGFGLAALAAPLLGGWILDHYSWRWLFWSMMIFVAVVTPLFWLTVPESTLRLRQRLDFAGAALLASGVALVLLYLANGATWGWGSGTALACLFSGLLLLVAFVVTEHFVSDPIIDMRLLFDPKVSLVLANSLITAVGIGIMAYSIPYMTQSPTREQLSDRIIQELNQSAQASRVMEHVDVNIIGDISFALGFTLLGFATHVAVFAYGTFSVAGVGTGAWSRRVGLRIPLITATATLAASAVLFLIFNHTWGQYAAISVLQGIGLGAFYASIPNLIVEAVPAAQQGISSGMYGVSNAMGMSLGTAIVTASQSANQLMFSVDIEGKSGPVQAIPQLYTASAYDFSFYVAAAACIIGLIIAILMRHGRAPAAGGAP